MDRKQRVFLLKDDVLTDVSTAVERYDSASAGVALDVGDALYIASELPFNHRWLAFETANTDASDLSVSIWNGQEFVSVLDLVDETASGGAALGQNGKVSFTPDRDEAGWRVEQKSKDIAELADGPQVYGMFWSKLTVSAALSAGTALKYVGQQFCTDQDLFDVYPDLNRSGLMAAFAAGKTDWIAQEVIASEQIVDDLRQRRVVVRRDQIMDASLLRDACRHKTAEIIYRGLGNGHLDNRVLAAKDYKSAMAKDFFEVDQTGDGVASEAEKRWSTSFGRR